jgi:ketosteroid isomerase-like protein
MERSAEIEALVTSWFTAATKGDASLVDQYVPNDPDARLIGSDPAEWLRGGDAIGAFLRNEIGGAGGDVTFTPSETESYAEGSVGWAATKLTLRLPDGRQIHPRWTAVLRRGAGGWQFVQTHASIAVPNDEVGWTYE